MQNNLSPENNIVPEVVPEMTSEMAPEVTSEVTPEMTSEMAPEVTSEVTPEMTSEMAPEVTSEVIPEMTPEMVPEVTPEMTLEMASEATPEMIPEVASEATSEVTPEMIPEVVPEMASDIDLELEKEQVPEFVAEKDSFMDLPENINKEEPGAEEPQSHFYTEEQAQSMMPSTDHDIVHEGKTYAGFFARFTAYLLDRIILLVPLGIFRLILWILTAGGKFAILNQQVFFRFTPAGMLTYALSAAYFIIFTYITGRTVGKRIMRLKVVSAEDRKPSFLEILYRETFGRFLSTIILCIGYLMIIIGDEKEALHDYLSDTRVIYR